RPNKGRRVYYGFVNTLDVEERRQGISEAGYGIRDTWVDLTEAIPKIALVTLGEVSAKLHEHDTQDLYALLEDAQDGLSQAVHHELQTHRDHVYAHETYIQVHQAQLQLQSTLIQTQHQVHETRSQIQQIEMAELRDTDRRRKARMVEILRVMRDIRREMSDMQAELLALRRQQRARQLGLDARIPDHQDASGDADRTEGFVGLTRWIENMESVFNISGYAIENQVKFATCTLLGAALTWWNGQIRTLGPDAYSMTWEVLKKKMTDKYCPQGEIVRISFHHLKHKNKENRF
ncbi:hypothetical protein Tco_0986905, partial [Tanacetum coccineum]